MTKNESTRTCIYIDQKLLARCDVALAITDDHSRSEFICHALEHYLAVLNMQSNSKVLTPALESVIGGKIAGTEDRISRSIDVKTVSSMLGHSSAGFTLATYTHATNKVQEQAAAKMGNLLKQAL